MEASYIAIVILVILLVVSNVTWGLYPYYYKRQTPICIEMDADWRVSKVIIINGDRNGGINEPRYSNVTQLCRKLKYTFERSPSMFVTSPEYIDSCGHVNTNDKGVQSLCGCMFAHKIALQKIANQSERMMILEDDAIEANDTYEIIRHKIDAFLLDSRFADVAYVGHCYGTQCTHAIAIYPESARKILQMVDFCSTYTPIDSALTRLCQSSSLVCAYAQHTTGKPGAWADGIIHQDVTNVLRVRDQSDYDA